MKKKILSTNNIRKTILTMAHRGSSVHIGCALSIVEILSVLYERFICYPNNNLNHPNRDYLILSKGHGVMAQYACMYELGFLKKKHIFKYFSDGSLLKGLSDSRIEGIEVSSGSLGHGLSVACGLAMGANLKKSNQKIFCVVGDGEINEGSIWEAFLFISQHKLKNLILIIDANGFQALGKTNDILSLGKLSLKLSAFGFNVKEINGHDRKQLIKCINASIKLKFKPSVIIAKTIKGKGITFMENDNNWHYKRLDDDLYTKAISELKNFK